MIRKSCLVLLLASSFAAAQGTAPAGPKPENKKPPEAAAPSQTPAAKPTEVPADAPVITLNGVCEKQPAGAPGCKTVVTRADFDRLISALAPGQAQVSAERKQQFAMQYARLLTAAIEAEKMGLQNSPETKELIHFVTMQALAQELSRKLLLDAQPAAEEMQNFYKENAAKLEEITFRRIIIPAAGGKGALPREELKKFADQLQKRAAAGEDFDKLQKEAYEKVGIPNPPSTTVVLQSQTLTPEEETAAQAKPGEISQVVSQPTAFTIYELVGRKPIPFDKVKPEIEATLRQQKYQSEVEKLLNAAPPVLNEKYFGTTEEHGAVSPGSKGTTDETETEHQHPVPQTKPSGPPHK